MYTAFIKKYTVSDLPVVADTPTVLLFIAKAIAFISMYIAFGGKYTVAGANYTVSGTEASAFVTVFRLLEPFRGSFWLKCGLSLSIPILNNFSIRSNITLYILIISWVYLSF